MHQMMEYITVIIHYIDQGAFNFWLNWKPFRQIVFKLLDKRMFLGGNDVTVDRTRPEDIETYHEFILFHAFSTRDHFDKITKFHQIGHWYFTEERCPGIFDEGLLPDLNDRIGDHLQAESSGYLLNHSLITDKRNVYHVRRYADIVTNHK